MKFASAILENSRLKPAAGEILESFGLRVSADQTRRCCTMLPMVAASISSANGSATAAMVPSASVWNVCRRPRPSTGI